MDETEIIINDDDSTEDVAEKWVTIEMNDGSSFVLSVLDKMALLSGAFLNDNHMTAAQKLLLHQFPGTKGLQSTLYLDKIAASQTKIAHGLQIIHDRTNHWIVASNLQRKDNIVEMYDSIYTSVSVKTQNLVKNIFQPFPSSKNPRLQLVKTQKQVGTQDCGLFAIAMATAILNGHDTKTVRFRQQSMRDHLARCYEEQSLTLFPTEIM